MMKKLNWKPWQIILSALAGVAVIGGGAAGIWYGVSNNDLPEEPSVMVTETATAEPALDEPTAAATETETETDAEKEPDTVIVYATPSESETDSETDSELDISQPQVQEREPSTLSGERMTNPKND